MINNKGYIFIIIMRKELKYGKMVKNMKENI